MTASNLVAMTGRVKTYLEQPEKGTMPVSCTVYEYSNDLFAAMKYVDIALRGGAGINVILDKFESEPPTEGISWYFDLSENHPDFKQIPSHLLPLANPVVSQPKDLLDVVNYKIDGKNYEVISVNDSMEESTIVLSSIQKSWQEFYECLIDGKIALVDVKRLRPNGSTNSKGLVASGAASFLGVYEAIAEYVKCGDIKSLMNVFGAMNDVLRRGGRNKNGIVLASLHYKHPDIIKYLNIPLAELKGSMKKSIRLDDGIVNDDRLMKLLAIRVNDKSMMTEKIQADGLYSNVCLSGDTWVVTREGNFQIKDLEGKIVEVWDGNEWTKAPFFKTSESAQLCEITLHDGTTVKCTRYHQLILENADRIRAWDLKYLNAERKLMKFLYDGMDSYVLDVASPVVSFSFLENSEPTWCCHVDTTNAFLLSNGLLVGNCKEIVIPSGGTCLILHINLGQVESFDQIPLAMCEAVNLGLEIFNTWERHPQYLDSEGDRQIGIGFIGLANLLARFEIKYKDFVEHLEAWLDPDREMSLVNNRIIDLCYAFEKGYYQASAIAKEAKLDRVFTIAPTQTSAYNHTDLDGNTTCKNINPPIKRRVQRQSQVMDSMNKWYYHGKVETMAEFLESMPIDPVTGKDGVQRLWEAWQTMMDNTGLAHTMSFDLYRKIDVDWLRDFVLNSPLQTTYYMLADQIDQSHLNKGVALTASDAEQCAIDNQEGCVSCAE